MTYMDDDADIFSLEEEGSEEEETENEEAF
jgi:hypothetical protein